MPVSERVSIDCTPFNGPLALAAALVDRAWKGNREFGYDERFLTSHLAPRGGVQPVAVAAQAEGRLNGFVAALPREVTWNGQPRLFALMTFFAVEPDLQGRGIGARLWQSCLTALRARGFDGVIHYCAAGNRSNDVTVAGAAAAGCFAHRVRAIQYLRLLLRGGSSSSAEASKSVDTFMSAAEAAASKLRLARRWSRTEAEFHMWDRPDAFVVTEEGGSGALAIAGHLRTIADSGQTRCVVVDDVLVAGGPVEESVRVARQFLACAADSARLAIVPDASGSDLTFLRSLGFRRSPTVMNAYVTLWEPWLEPPASMPIYMDVM
jgi:GNAT superfamily N-acetyltransferase